MNLKERSCSLYLATSIQSIAPHQTSWKSNLILSSHVHLGLPSGLFPSSLTTKTLYALLLSLTRVTSSAHLILLDWTTRKIFGEYTPLSCSSCSFLQTPATSSLSGPNTFLRVRDNKISMTIIQSVKQHSNRHIVSQKFVTSQCCMTSVLRHAYFNSKFYSVREV